MTDKVQKIKEWVRTRKLCTMDEHMKFYCKEAESDYNLLCSLEKILDSMQEEPVSEDLEKAAIKYAQDKYMPIQTSQAFKAGAQWQKQQMMKDCLDYTIMKAQYCDENLPPLKDLATLPLIRFSPAKLLERGLKVGDKVKVIIIKEN